MTDDVRGNGLHGDGDRPTGEQPTFVPPPWPQQDPPTGPAQAWPAAFAWQGTPQEPGRVAPAPAVAPAAWAPGTPLTSFPPAAPQAPPPAGFPPPSSQASPPVSPEGKRIAPWAVSVPAPRPPVGSPPPMTGPQRQFSPPPAGYAGQPFVVPPQAAPPSRGAGSSATRGVLIALALVLVAGAAGGTTWFVLRDNGTSQQEATNTFDAPLTEAAPGNGGALPGGASVGGAPTASAVPTTSAPATPTAMTEQQALTELQTLRSASLPRLVTDDRWVAQVASKSVGITDPLQTAANGTHTFYAVDILADSEAQTASVPASSVLVLQSTDFGKRSYSSDGQAYWITVVDEGFGSSEQVKAWCASTYPSLTPEQLANACAARTLSPPHD